MKYAVFDVDGTLIDSMYVWDTAGDRYVRGYKKEPEEDLWLKLKHFSLLQAAEYLVNTYEIPRTAQEAVEEICAQVAEEYSLKVKLKPGVAQYLEKLKNLDIPMCVATASDASYIYEALKRLDVAKYFQNVYTCGSVGYAKDDVRFFEAVAQQTGTKASELTVFEDALHSIRTARQAGCRVIALYDERAELDWNEICNLADEHYQSFLELL